MVERIGYKENLDQIELLLREGPLGVKCENYSLVKRPWHEKVWLTISLGLSLTTDQQKGDLKKVYSLAGIKAQMLSAANLDVKNDSSYFDDYFTAEKTIKLWNDYRGGWQEKLIEKAKIFTALPKIDYSGTVVIDSPKFNSLITFSYIKKDRIPLVVTSKNPELTLSKFRQLVENDLPIFQKLFDQHRAFLFKNFKAEDDIQQPLKSLFGYFTVPYLIDNKDILLIDKNFHDSKVLDDLTKKINQHLN